MKKILMVLLVLLASGCSSPTPNFYQPVAVKEADVTYTRVNGTVLLNQVLLPAEAARPQIATLGGNDYEVKIDEFNRWGAAPEKLIQNVLNDDLSAYLPNAVIENQTPLRKDYRYAVAVEITEMNGRLKEFAKLKASYFIKNKMGKVIKTGKFERQVEINGGYKDYVPAQSNLLGELAADIAKTLAKVW